MATSAETGNVAAELTSDAAVITGCAAAVAQDKAAAVTSNSVTGKVAALARHADVSNGTEGSYAVTPAVPIGATVAPGAAAVPLLIDTDCGIDDAQAIMMAAAHPEKVKIIALTTVDGQSPFSTLPVFGQGPHRVH